MSRSEPVILASRLVAILNQGEEKPPANWSTRALYLGQQGADNWLGVLGQAGQPLHHRSESPLGAAYLTAVARAEFQTFVSLGAGDGAVDAQILAASPGRSYIPIDCSRPLLAQAVRNLSDLVNVPAEVLCDLESDMELAGDAVRQYAVPPIIFAMLGGTIGNLDCKESEFLANLLAIMPARSQLLLDVPLCGGAWPLETDRRMNVATYSSEFLEFLRWGAERRGLAPEGVQDLEGFRSRIASTLGHDSDIPQTQVVTIELTAPRRQTLLRFRHYDWPAFHTWIESRGLRIEHAILPALDNEAVAVAVLLLSKTGLGAAAHGCIYCGTGCRECGDGGR